MRRKIGFCNRITRMSNNSASIVCIKDGKRVFPLSKVRFDDTLTLQSPAAKDIDWYFSRAVCIETFAGTEHFHPQWPDDQKNEHYERERDRETERQRDRERQRETETETERQRERETERETHRERDTERESFGAKG